MNSLWEQQTAMPTFPHLDGDKTTDVLIIGGGMAGVLCAYMLEQSGVDYILVEAKTIGDGITRNTTAKITSQHGLVYDRLITEFGMERAKQYLDANQKAVQRFRELEEKLRQTGKTDCHMKVKDAYVYSLDNRYQVEREVAALGKLGFRAEFEQQLPLPFPVAGAVRFPEQAQFNPLAFLAGIAVQLNIYEHTKVREMVGKEAVTEYGRIRADKVIVATHFPFLNKHGSYFLKLYQHDRSYVIALEKAGHVHGMYVDEAPKGMSFRDYGKYLLIGGATTAPEEGGGWQELREFARKHYPDAREEYHWATQDCMSLDGIPYIGQYSAKTEDWFVISGFNKWGMSSSMVAAELLCDMVQGRRSPYQEVFSPSRSIWRPQLAVNGWEAVTNLLTPAPKRCPHMGCALKWNKEEHTWDCTCHGSRFAKDGQLLDNPATGDLK